MIFLPGKGWKKHSVFVGQMVKWPFRVIPQALKAARTLLPAHRRIVGVEGKVDLLEEHHSSLASRGSWRLYRVWGAVTFLPVHFFSISIFLGGEEE